MKKNAMSKATLIRERTTIEVDNKDITGWLRRDGHVPATAKDVTVTFRVPDGGDYSGVTLDVEDALPVTVTWVTETEHKTDF